MCPLLVHLLRLLYHWDNYSTSLQKSRKFEILMFKVKVMYEHPFFLISTELPQHSCYMHLKKYHSTCIKSTLGYFHL